MAYQSIWYQTDIPVDVISLIEKDVDKNYQHQMFDSELYGGELDKTKRNSQNAWIPTTHWVGGFLWHYIQKANRENFLYDLSHIDNELIQFTRYTEGQFYKWHVDAGLGTYFKPNPANSDQNTRSEDFLNKNTESIRKLSFLMQLSDPDDYEGGNVQLLDEGNNSYFAPRKRGTMIFFDSRTQHRVLKVTKGVRKSLVGWVCGPRWR